MDRAGNSSGGFSLAQEDDIATGGTLYELPNCSICLSELTENLTNLSCGHVYHAECIYKHFSYKTTCPNCQKRSHATVQLLSNVGIAAGLHEVQCKH